MLENGEITEGHARALLALPSIDKIIEYANIVVEKYLNVRQLELLVKNFSTATKIDAAFPRRAAQPSDFDDDVERFKNKYKLTLKVDGGRRGMGVQIKGLKKWQLQMLLEYIDNHAEELFPRE
jgi:ParB family chromosome partitioning protein